MERMNAVLEHLVLRLRLDKNPVEQPKAFLLGGPPGSGKSRLTPFIEADLNKNIIVINGDEFRPLHPDVQILQQKHGERWVEHTGDFSGKLTEDLIAYFSNLKYNLLIEGTLRTSTVPEKTAHLLREKNYEVSLLVMCVKPEISYLSTLTVIKVGKLDREIYWSNFIKTFIRLRRSWNFRKPKPIYFV